MIGPTAHIIYLPSGWKYKLEGPQQSSPFSLIFNGQYLSRLQFTIGYNFLLLLNVNRYLRCMCYYLSIDSCQPTDISSLPPPPLALTGLPSTSS